MEEAYGVGVANRYALFLDEESAEYDASSPQKGGVAVAGAKGVKAAPGAKVQAGKTSLNDSKSNAAVNKDQCKFIIHVLLLFFSTFSISFRFV